MNDTVLETRELTKSFGAVTAVEDVSIEVKQSEVFGLLGPNGAGKSTLIDMCAGYVRPTAGNVRVFGENPVTDGEIVREQVGIVPDGHGLFRDWTGRDHVNYIIESKNLDVDPEAVLERVGLLDAIDRRTAEYSAGMRKRLVIATAIAGDPPLLVLDEPSSGLDPEGMQRLRDIVSTQAKRGTTVVVSSHRLGQLERFCTRVAVLRDGAVQRIESLDDFHAKSRPTNLLHVVVDHVPDDLVTRTAELDGVENVTVQGDRVTVTCTDRTQKPALDTIASTDAVVLGFDVESRSLESLFFEVTAEAAR